MITGKSNDNLFDVKEQDKVFADFEDPIATFLRKACHRKPEKRHADAALSVGCRRDQTAAGWW